jgi:nitrate reductase gamma subunit
MKLAILKIFTVLWLMGMYLTLMLTFIAAYDSPQKAVRVAINNYQEANMEMAMLLGSLFVSTIGTAYLILDIRKDFLERNVRLVSRTAD